MSSSSEAGPSRLAAPTPATVGSALASHQVDDDSMSDSDSDDDMATDAAPSPSSLLPTAPSSSSAAQGSSLDPTLPAFTPLSASQLVLDRKDEFRRVTIPLHRITPLKKEWADIYAPLVEMVHLQVRFNMKRKCVELKVRSARSSLPCAAGCQPERVGREGGGRRPWSLPRSSLRTRTGMLVASARAPPLRFARRPTSRADTLPPHPALPSADEQTHAGRRPDPEGGRLHQGVRARVRGGRASLPSFALPQPLLPFFGTQG